MKNLIGLSFLLVGVSLLVFFGLSSITTMMDSANETINSSEDPALASSFNTASNVTIGAFSVMSNIPLLIVVLIVFIVLFMFVGIVTR